jgi:hypothetical protein
MEEPRGAMAVRTHARHEVAGGHHGGGGGRRDDGGERGPNTAREARARGGERAADGGARRAPRHSGGAAAAAAGGGDGAAGFRLQPLKSPRSDEHSPVRGGGEGGRGGGAPKQHARECVHCSGKSGDAHQKLMHERHGCPFKSSASEIDKRQVRRGGSAHPHACFVWWYYLLRCVCCRVLACARSSTLNSLRASVCAGVGEGFQLGTQSAAAQVAGAFTFSCRCCMRGSLWRRVACPSHRRRACCSTSLLVRPRRARRLTRRSI